VPRIVDVLGAPVAEWIGFLVLGGAFGLALGVTAQPQFSALPEWFPRLPSQDLTHLLYGAVVGLGGVVFVTLFSRVLGILFATLGEGGAAALVALWLLVVLGASLVGSEGAARRRIAAAHAKTLGGLFALLLLGIAVGRLAAFKSLFP
jgi:hypothetical protein